MNNVRQLGLGIIQFEGTYRRFPAGAKRPKDPAIRGEQRFFWSGQILPNIDQSALRDSIDPELPWNIPGTPNYAALQKHLPIFRCPSANAPSRIDHEINDRVPGTYLAVASGLIDRESKPSSLADIAGTIASLDLDLDGMFFTDSEVRHEEILDGTSSTIMIGESLYLQDITGPDYFSVQLTDHWYIGSPQSAPREVSEFLGSTAIPINRWLQKGFFIEELELGFSSRHRGGVQVVFADGHTRFVEQDIDLQTWSALGTRMNGDSAQE